VRIRGPREARRSRRLQTTEDTENTEGARLPKAAKRRPCMLGTSEKPATP